MELLKTMFLAPVTTDEIKEIIKKLKSNSSGWDGIISNIIKQTYPNMLEPLCHIINLSFDKGCVPDQLKLANVVPTFKNGDAKRIASYRPISVLPVFSKIFERLMYIRLTKYVTKNNILSNSQFGFKKGHSTYMALTILIDKITKAIDKKTIQLDYFYILLKLFTLLTITSY